MTKKPQAFRLRLGKFFVSVLLDFQGAQAVPAGKPIKGAKISKKLCGLKTHWGAA